MQDHGVEGVERYMKRGVRRLAAKQLTGFIVYEIEGFKFGYSVKFQVEVFKD